MATDTQGTVLKAGDGATPTEVFTAVGAITGVSGFGSSRNSIDITALSDTVEKVKPGLERLSEITLNINHDEDDTGHTTLRADYDAKTLRNFQIVTTDATPVTIAFSAYVMSYSWDLSLDDVIRATVTLKPSDTAPTFT